MVNSQAIDPNTPSTLYAGERGVHKSTDGGATWAAINNGLLWDQASITAMVIDPNTPSTLYVGFYAGVYKTTDGGTNWSAANSRQNFASIQSLAIDPNMLTTLYAGSSASGVFMSTDGGASWAIVNDGLTSLWVQALTVNPAATDTVYAGTFTSIFKGVDLTPPNAAPVAVDDGTVTSVNTAITIDVLANDTDENSDPLSITAVSAASNGAATISGSQVVYTPTLDFTGTDTFTYTVSDGSLTDSATVTVLVRAAVGSCINKSNLIEQLQRTSFYSDANPIYASAGQSFTAPDGVTFIDGITAYFGFIAENATITLNLYNGPASGEIGAPFATATYTNTGDAMWDESGAGLEVSFRFNSPVILTPGNVYYYLLSPSFNPSAFGFIIADNNPYSEGTYLSGLSDGTVSSSPFPEWDLKFAVFLCAGDEPFSLTSRGPAAGAVGVSLSQNITATFDAALNASTVTTQTFRARSELRGVLNGAFTVDGSSLIFNPAQDFVMGEQVQVMATSDIQSVDGRSLTPTQWNFTAGPVTARCVEGFTDTGASLTNISNGSVDWAADWL